MPTTIALTAALLALVFILIGYRRSSIVSLLTAICVLWVSSLPVVAGILLWSLDRHYPPVSIEDTPASDCIVVLGGSLALPVGMRVDIELTETTDRVYQAARLYRYGKGKTIIVAAGNQPWKRDMLPEAHHIQRLLMEWGVPKQSILLDRSSKNTHENAVNATMLMQDSDCHTTLLITSGWHMPRAWASFNKSGVEVFPVSVDVRMAQGSSGLFGKLIPTADALAITSMVIREYMGILVYRMRDWA